MPPPDGPATTSFDDWLLWRKADQSSSRPKLGISRPASPLSNAPSYAFVRAKLPNLKPLQPQLLPPGGTV